MKKSILIFALLGGIATANLFAAENMVSIGVTTDFSYWKDIRNLSGADLQQSVNERNFSWGMDLDIYTFYGRIFGMAGDINLTFLNENNRFFRTWGILDIFFGPVFRIPLGNVFSVMISPGVDFRVPTTFNAMFLGVGGMAGVTLGLGEDVFLLAKLNVNYDVFNPLEMDRLNYISVRPTIAIGRRLD